MHLCCTIGRKKEWLWKCNHDNGQQSTVYKLKCSCRKGRNEGVRPQNLVPFPIVMSTQDGFSYRSAERRPFNMGDFVSFVLLNFFPGFKIDSSARWSISRVL